MNDPVFIVGPGRSGTSLLYRTLLKHSAFRSNRSKQMSLRETHIYSLPLVGYNVLCGLNRNLLGYMLGETQYYNLFQRKIRKLSYFQKILNRIPSYSYGCRKSSVLWKLSLNHIIVRNYFCYAQKARVCRRIVEKSPAHIYSIDKIFSTYKDAKIIITIRHPVHVFSSMVKRANIQPEKKWLKIGTSEFIRQYKSQVTIALKESASRNSNITVVFYEDFVRDPRKEFMRICEFLSEDFESRLLSEGEESLGFWEIDPYLSKPITQKTKNWNDYVSKKDANIIEKNLQNLMTKLGYESVIH